MKAAADINSHQQAEASLIFKAQFKQFGPAYLDKLDEYMEDLYDDDMTKKVSVVKMCGGLGRNPKEDKCE